MSERIRYLIDSLSQGYRCVQTETLAFGQGKEALAMPVRLRVTLAIPAGGHRVIEFHDHEKASALCILNTCPVRQ